MGFKPCARIAGSPLKHLLTAKYLPNTKSNIYKNLWNNSTSVWNYSTTPRQLRLPRGLATAGAVIGASERIGGNCPGFAAQR